MSNKNIILVFVSGAERYKKIVCNTKTCIAEAIEEQLYILWEIEPLSHRWMNELEDFGSTTYSYHGTTFDKVDMYKTTDTITIIVDK